MDSMKMKLNIKKMTIVKYKQITKPFHGYLEVGLA